MKQDALKTPSRALDTDDSSVPRQQQLDLWPARWAWEEDNVADGLGVGPFPAARKPPKRADPRQRPADRGPELDD